jgi:hypothetical protein
MGMCVVPKINKWNSLIMTPINRVLSYIIKYGDEMRARIDIGFSAVEDNSKPPDST